MASTQDAEIFVARQYAKPIDEKAFRCEIEMIEAIILNQVSSYDHAVRAFASDTENSARYKIQINLWATWRLILDTAKTFSQTHAGLIKLVVGLQQLPDVIVQVNGQHQVFQPMENEVLWRDLPLLQASLREEVYNYGWFQDETTRDQEKQQYLNIYAFIAKLSANSTVEPPAYQFPRCLANLRNALESQPWTVDLKGTEYEGFRNEYSSVRTYLAVELPPAVQWILHAGQWIWQGSKGDWHWWEETALDWSEFDTWDGFPWPREWKGHLGFSRERWAFWKERFTAITELAEIDDDTRQLAAQGFEAMQRFETA